jgi:hypothetical protein
MKLNSQEFEKIAADIRANPDKAEELLKDFKLFHSFFGQDDGIPPRFKSNFRQEPGWEKVTGLDFEAIGRILVCHLCIEHYLENLIELSTPAIWDWESTRLTFYQKFKLVKNIRLLKDSKFDRGIDIVNSLRNKLSHDMMAKIDKCRIEELKAITLEYVSKGKTGEDLNEIRIHFELFDVHATLERFTSLVCSMIGGYCSRIIDGTIDAESYYNKFRSQS